MKIKTKKYSAIITYILIVLILGCQKESVPTEFQKYVDTFVSEAQKRGVNIDLNKYKIKIQFSSSPNVSECSRYGTERTISISQQNWERLDDLGKELLLFHELGHCQLSLDHTNCQLPDGSSKSMMCGINGHCSEANYCFTIYGGMKRDYYLDQLFNENAPTPEWSKIAEFKDKYSTFTKQVLTSEEFNDTLNINSLGLGKFGAEFIAGKMNIDGTSLLKFKNLSNFTNQDNIEIETSFRLYGTTEDDIGFYWVPLFSPELYNSFIFHISKIQNDFFLGINIRGLAGYYNNINQYINPNGYNTMKIQRVGSIVYFYLNNKLFFIQDAIPISKSSFLINNQPPKGEFFLGTYGKCSLDYVSVKRII